MAFLSKPKRAPKVLTQQKYERPESNAARWDTLAKVWYLYR